MSNEKEFKWIDSECFKYDQFQAFYDHEFDFKMKNQKNQNRQSFESAWKYQQEIIDAKDKEIERYRKALEFYADTRKWGVTCSDDLPDFQDSDDNEELRNDDNQRITKGGKTARQALGDER